MITRLQRRIRTHGLLDHALPWLGFALVLLWGWRVYDLFNRIPAYGDALEVVWGIQQYHDVLFQQHSLPLFTPLVFAPNGWHTATLAHTPLLFLLAQPFYLVGGVAFAYNALALLSLVVAFAGSYKLVKQYTGLIAACAAALVYTFLSDRWFRIAGHLHILWASSLLPWLVIALLEIKQTKQDQGFHWRLLVTSGLLWGLMVNFSYYSVFLGAIAFAVWGRQLFSRTRLKQAFVIVAVAVLVSAPTLILYQAASRQDDIQMWNMDGLWGWGASLNSLVDVSRVHPIPILKQLSTALYSGPTDESGVVQLGIVTALLSVAGIIWTMRSRRERTGFVWLAGIGLVLSLGIFLRWNGDVLQAPVFQTLDTFIWNLGHALKPNIFTSATPDQPYNQGVPLPGYVLMAVVPFFESARVMARYGLAGGVALIALAAVGLQRLPAKVRWFIALIWIVEILPAPTSPGVPITTLATHPAYAWLGSQTLNANENVIDLYYPTVIIGGEVLYATQYHHKPTVSGIGSYMPKSVHYLWNYLITENAHHEGSAITEANTIKLLAQYHVRYVLFHLNSKESQLMWFLATQNPLLRAVQCFDPNKGPSPWRYPICVAEVLPEPINMLTVRGWSQPEGWGMWAEGNGRESQADWVATAPTDYLLTIDAFPYCPAKQATDAQEVRLEVNGKPLTNHQWQKCEQWHEVVTIPGAMLHTGLNHLALRYAHATRPSDDGTGSQDQRLLSVGFNQLSVQRK